jgi:hypothetical protein
MWLRDFNDRRNFLRCLDAVGCKYVNIKCSDITTVKTDIFDYKNLVSVIRFIVTVAEYWLPCVYIEFREDYLMEAISAARRFVELM